MPKLTRTQRFAELREQIANDKEASVSTQQLSQFENKLNSFNGYSQNTNPQQENQYVWTPFPGEMPAGPAPTYVAPAAPEQTTEIPVYRAPVAPAPEAPVYVAPVAPTPAPVVETPVYVAPPVQETVAPTPAVETPVYTAPVVETPVYQAPVQEAPVYVAPVEPAPAVETPVYVAPVAPTPAPVVETPVYVAPPVQEPVAPTPVVEQPKVEAPAPAVEEPKQSDSYFDYFSSIIDDTLNITDDKSFDEYFKQTPVEEPAPAPAPAPVQPVNAFEATFDNLLLDADEEAPIDNDYLYNTLNEIHIYNQNKGMQTIDQLTSNMVDEVLHNDKPEDITAPSANVDFSNTVSTEISRAMDNVLTSEPVVQETVAPTPAPAVQTPIVEEHPVLTKTLEEEKSEPVVEIRNLKDFDSATMKDTISGTIPFVVANKNEEIEEEEEGSNTVLNIILIVLIVILVAVLGLIVFYILKTKGIF